MHGIYCATQISKSEATLRKAGQLTNDRSAEQAQLSDDTSDNFELPTVGSLSVRLVVMVLHHRNIILLQQTRASVLNRANLQNIA
jgi:hypothetical protein